MLTHPLGAAQVAALAQAGHEPIAASRSPPSSLQIDGHLVRTAAVDFTDRAAVEKTLKDTAPDAIFVTLPATAFQPAERVLRGAAHIGELAAAQTSIQLAVFNASTPVPEDPQDVKVHVDRLAIRAALRAHGLPVVSLQPVVYLDNLLEGWARPALAERHTVLYCHQPTLEVSWLCHDDMAALMVAALTRPHLAGRNLPVGGGETVRLPVLAEKLGRGWGRRIEWESQSLDDFCEKLSDALAGTSLAAREDVVKDTRAVYEYYRATEEFKVDMEQVLRELPVKMTTIEEWAEKHPFPT